MTVRLPVACTSAGMQRQGLFQAGVPGIIRGRRVSWYTAGLLAMLFVLFLGVVALILSFALRPSAALSGFVQAHGVRREAVIVSVDDIASKSSKSTTYAAQVLVSVAVPVGGQARTTVHVPRNETDRPPTPLPCSSIPMTLGTRSCPAHQAPRPRRRRPSWPWGYSSPSWPSREARSSPVPGAGACAAAPDEGRSHLTTLSCPRRVPRAGPWIITSLTTR